MQQVDISEKLFLSCAANAPRVRYSAAYSTGAERVLRRGTKTTVVIKG